MIRKILPLVSVIVLMTVAAPLSLAGHGAEIRINGDLVEGAYLHELEQHEAVWTLGALHRDGRGDAVYATFHVVGNVSSKSGWSHLRAGLGGELVSVDPDGPGSGGALAIGGFLRYAPESIEKLSLRLDARWAPGVLSFGDLDEFGRYGLEIGYDVVARGTVFLGARTIRIKSGDQRGNLDSGLHLGLRFSF